jgi:hypothetical protein
MSTSPGTTRGPAATLAAMRGFVLIIFLLGALGIGTELLLVGHTEDGWQWVPLVLILISYVVLGWHALARRAASVRVFQWTMVLFMMSGVAGLLLHYRGNVEFKLETHPTLSGWALFWEAIKGKVPPALAPANMIHIGLLGLAYTYRHPALAASTEDESTHTGEP